MVTFFPMISFRTAQVFFHISLNKIKLFRVIPTNIISHEVARRSTPPVCSLSEWNGLRPSKQFWRFLRWSDHQFKTWYIGGFCKSATGGTDHVGVRRGGLLVGPTTSVRRGDLLVGPTTNFRRGILVVFANWPPVGPTTSVRRGGLLVGPTMSVQRGGLLVGPTTNFIRTWYIGGFCKSATGGTDHVGPT